MSWNFLKRLSSVTNHQTVRKRDYFIKFMQSFTFWEISRTYTPNSDNVTMNMNNLINVKFINIFYRKKFE